MESWFVAGALLALGLGACGGKQADEPVGNKRAPLTLSGEAAQRWDSLCVTCHGKTGQGDGPGAAALKPKPRSFSDGAWQASVTDEHLRKVIIEGGQAVKLSPLMPPNGDLRNKPEVLEQLVKKVRSFAP